jgi:hypothetical protein
MTLQISVRAAVILAGVLAISSTELSAARQATGAGRGGAATVVAPPGRPTVFLWPNGAPGSEARRDEPEEIQGETVRNVHNPAVVVFLPRNEISTGAGLVLAPGGGHTSLWIMHEGFNPAQLLTDKSAVDWRFMVSISPTGTVKSRSAAARTATRTGP